MLNETAVGFRRLLPRNSARSHVILQPALARGLPGILSIEILMQVPACFCFYTASIHVRTPHGVVKEGRLLYSSTTVVPYV